LSECNEKPENNNGGCFSWESKVRELGDVPGNEELVKKEWDKLDEFAYNFIWFWVQR